MNGAGGLLVVRFFSIERTVNVRARAQIRPSIVVSNFRGAFAFGVFDGFIVADDESEQLGGLAGVIFVVRLELLPVQLDQLGVERIVLGQPLVFFDLGALAVAGVRQEMMPVVRELHAIEFR